MFLLLNSFLASHLPPSASPQPSYFLSLLRQFLASLFTFLLCRELCVVLTFPQWHLKCFLVQNILFIAIETGNSVWKKKWGGKESDTLWLCNSVILPKSINGNTLGDMQTPTHC